MQHDIEFTPDAIKELNGFDRQIRLRVVKAAEKLANFPNVSGIKPMTGNLAGHWRLRVADKYRILFRVEGTTVLIVSVGHRDGFYD